MDFEELYELRSYTRALLGNDHDGDDALQNAALRALLALRGGAVPVHERAWLRRIAHNEAISLLRARRPVQSATPDGVADPAADPAAVLERRETLAALLDGVRTLSPRARQVVLMSWRDGAARSEIAAALHMGEAAVSASLWRSRAALRQIRAAR
jgi:RNA polymerase sigma-70 factor (ECF subfamily)